MNTFIFGRNDESERHFPGRERLAAWLHSRQEHGCGDREEFEQAFGGRERGFDCHGERGPGGRGRHEHGHGFGPGFGRGFGGFGPGGFEGGFGGRGPGGMGGRGRLFDAGDVKLVVLKLLSEQPSYGYQLIKTMEQRLSGGYTPSAGVIYPTLTMLEEEGLTTASTENNKKVYSVTAEGTEFLENNKRRVEELFERLEAAGRGFERGRSPEIMRAFMDLWSAVASRVFRDNVTPEQIAKITDAIKAATKTIDEF